MTDWETIDIVIDLLRIVLLLALIGFYLLFISFRRSKADKHGRATEESASLLHEEHGVNGTAHYGTVPTGGKHAHTEGAPAGWSRPTKIPSRNWWEYMQGYSIFFPYLWPSKDRRLQIVVVVCFVIVVLQRVVNVLVPHQIGIIVNELSGEDNEDGDNTIHFPWVSICLYILYRFLQGNNGILGAARSTLWIPIGQYSYRELSVAAFEHVHNLSLDFHLGKKTGEVLSALGKGSSINTFLEQVTFSIVPMIVDLIVAIGYFLIYFDVYYALIVAIVTFWYVYITIRMAQWRAEIRRQMVNADREEDAVK
jgi:ATP-binding cassette, subfamily B, vacuolar membrane transporter HMT1/ACLQ